MRNSSCLKSTVFSGCMYVYTKASELDREEEKKRDGKNKRKRKAENREI